MEEKNISSRGGILIITGTSIGAGMFSLPVLTSNMWFGWAILFLCVSWYCMYSSALYVLETNQKFAHGANFDTMTKELLSPAFRFVNGLSIVFVSYILVYAYISGGGSMLAHSVNTALNIEIDSFTSRLIFALILALIVSFSTKAVDKFTTAMLGGMVISFSLAIFTLLSGKEISLLLPFENMLERLPFAWAALPSLMVCFGFHSNIPSLVKYYNKDSSKVLKSIRYGSLLALAIYILWLLATFTTIGRDGFEAVISAGGNMGALVGALEKDSTSSILSLMLQIFANFAVATSFLGVALGLFDFLSDMFKLDDSIKGRSKAAIITFLPAVVFSLFFPNGFIYAIGYAGFAAAVFALFTPVALAKKARATMKDTDFEVSGGNARMMLVIVFAGAVMIFQTLAMLGLLK